MEQLNAEVAMLKGLMKKGGQLGANEQLRVAEEKITALQDQVEKEAARMRELEELLDKTNLEKTRLETEAENVGAGNRQESNAMAEKISKLKDDLAKSEETTEVLRQILVEIRRLKMSPLRNLTGDSIDDLREERDRLMQENMKLKSGDYDENDKNPDSGNPTLVKYLRSKVSPTL